MLSIQEINRNLKEINELYSKARGQKKPQQYAKLAIIEACGWIEECMDEIVKVSMQNNLQVNSNKVYYKKKVIKPTYGFEYEQYFRNRLLMALIGIVHIEKIEARFQTNQEFYDFKSSLELLRDARNPNAHTHISTQTPTIQAPSLTISQLKKVQTGLRLFRKELNKIKFK